MEIGKNFHGFCNKLVIKNSDTLSSRYRSITKRLNTDFRSSESETSNSHYVGSYGRNTAISSISDLDMIYVLPYSVYETYNGYAVNGQSSLLQAVRTSIKKTYPHTDISADGQVVVVPFTDNVTFEVVPAFINKDGSFTFPNANDGGSWKITNPRPEIEAISSLNKLCNQNLIWLSRMMRVWKQEWSVNISGLLIDTLVYQFLKEWRYRDISFLYYDYLTRDFFSYLVNQDDKQTYWLAPGSGQYVYGGSFQYKAKQCYNIAREAIKNGRDESSFSAAHELRKYNAKKEWCKIYGNEFPS